MVPVRRVSDQFAARVIAARLGAEGIVTQLRGGGIDGLYPFGNIEILVPEDDVEVARDLLLADDVESAFDDGEPGSVPARWPWWVGAAVALVLVLAAFARVLDLTA